MNNQDSSQPFRAPLPPIAIGTWSWGDISRGFGSLFGTDDLAATFREGVRIGIDFFDTAEHYGAGESERLLGSFSTAEGGSRVRIGTKFSPARYHAVKGSLRNHLTKSLRRLGRTSVDLYQLHWLTRFSPVERWMDAMVDVHADGLARAVGVCNLTGVEMLRARDALARRGIALASVQAEYNLLRRGEEIVNLVRLCRTENISFLAYSPLANGFLSERQSGSTRESWWIRRYGPEVVQNASAIRRKLSILGERVGGRSIAQVALNWLVGQGAIPLIGARTIDHVKEAAGALDWDLGEAGRKEAEEAAN